MLIWSMIRPSKKGPSHSSGGGQTALSALSHSANSRDGRFLCPICPDQSSAGSHGTVAAPRVWLPACLFMMYAACLALFAALHGRLQKCLAQASPLPPPPRCEMPLAIGICLCFSGRMDGWTASSATKLDAAFRHLD